MIINTREHVLFIGDSIADCGRNKPFAQGVHGEMLGGGYVHLLGGWVQDLYPERCIRITNMGIGGNTIRHLKERWESDVVEQKPDWLSVMIGINDVWRQFDHPYWTDELVSPDVFTTTYREVLSQVRSNLKRLIIASPFFLEPNRNDPMRKRMDQYSVLAREMAEEFDAHFLDTQAAFDRYLEQGSPMALCADRVHPSVAGHTLITQEYLKVLRVGPFEDGSET
ncbi:MAG: SGNH/GDSL hydrolase family protein [Verrucomicrobiota bacterium]